MSGETAPTLIELFRRALESRVADVHVSCPGIVESYDAATRTASIQPAVRRVIFDDDGEQVEEDFPILVNVPVVWPGCGDYELHFPLAKGDTGDLIYSERSMSEWRETGAVSTPGDLRLHGVGCAKFYPGLRDTKQALATVGANEAVLSVGDGVLRVGGSTAGLVALAAKVDANFKAIKDMFTSWTPVANDGGAALKGLTGSLAFPATAVSKLKAE